MVPPARSVVGLIAVRVRLPKLPTSTSPGAAAMVCGPGPTGMAAPAAWWRRRSASPCCSPKSATNAVAAARGRHRDRDGHRLGCPPPSACPARHVPRSTGVTVFESRFATSAMPLPAGPAGRHRHRVGLDADARRVHHLVGRRCRSRAARRPPGSPRAARLPPGVYASAEGRLPTGTLAPTWRRARLTGVTSMPGRVTEAPVVTQATSWTDVLPTGLEQAASAGTHGHERGSTNQRRRRTVRSAPGARGAGRALGRAPPAGVALGPEVAGDVVLHVGHRRRLAGRQGAQRVEQGVDVVVGGAEPAAGPHRARDARCGRRAARRRAPGPRPRGRRRAGGSGRGARRSIRGARRSRTPRSAGPPPGRGACPPR